MQYTKTFGTICLKEYKKNKILGGVQYHELITDTDRLQLEIKRTKVPILSFTWNWIKNLTVTSVSQISMGEGLPVSDRSVWMD